VVEEPEEVPSLPPAEEPVVEVPEEVSAELPPSGPPTITPTETPPSVGAAPPPAAPPSFQRPKSSIYGRPIREITGREQDKKRDADRPERPKERAAPTIRLAAMPIAPKTPKKEKRGEPAPQKPDIKLPLDAIRASKMGAKPLSEQLRKREEKRAAEAKKGGRTTGETPTANLSETGSVADSARERGKRGDVVAGRDGGEGPMTLGGREQRQLKRKKSTAVKRVRGGLEDDDSGSGGRRPRHIRRTGANNTAAPRKGKIVVEFPCTVREFCEACGVPAKTVLGKLLQLGAMTNIAANLSQEMGELLAAELGLDVTFHQPLGLEAAVLSADEQEDSPESLLPRPPVITFLGHVDHGKTSLLDRILGLRVAAGEKGGITQHIRAYQIEKDGRQIAFVDTPGHEAFTEMRARGANVTDIAVLVVAADDGIMPQTEEAISHAKAAGVPIVVALNKIDLPSANVERAYQQLAATELLPTEWGGDTEVVKTSATTGAGMDELLETLLTVAELHDYRANPDRPAVGTCLEAALHEGRGVEAKILVQKGTLRVGDIVVCGPAYGRVKAMYDTLQTRKRFQTAGPSTPANITGLDRAPGAGDRFYVLDDIAKARELAASRQSTARAAELTGGHTHVTLETLFERLGQQDSVQTLNIIIRADVRGSIEAIRKELTKLEHPEVQIKVLQATVGGITEADVHLADASDAIIVGFNVVPDEGARTLADKYGVQVRRYDIIYQLTDDLRAALQGMLRPEKQEKDLGRALVQRAYHISRVGTVAGCRVLAGTITRDARVRVIRDSRIVGDYGLDSLKREKDDTREVREGMECGMKLAGFNDIKEGDLLEAYKIEEIARTF
jgi:translation initiation factor IF-2